MAASIAAADEERRNRVVAHLNRAHARELSHYLRHRAGVSPRAASRPALCDLTLQGMRIRAADGADYAVPFDPPLASWADVEVRVADMDAAARAHLGLSRFCVSAFAPPRGLDCVVFAAVVFYFACAASLPWAVPGTALGAALAAVFPGGLQWYRWTVRTLFLPVVAIHVTEVALLDRKLQRHGVLRWTRLWWLWLSSGFFEGVMAFRRMDAIIARQRALTDGKAQ